MGLPCRSLYSHHDFFLVVDDPRYVDMYVWPQQIAELIGHAARLLIPALLLEQANLLPGARLHLRASAHNHQPAVVSGKQAASAST